MISELRGHGTRQTLGPVVLRVHDGRKASEDRNADTHRQQQCTGTGEISMVTPHEQSEAWNDQVE
jgi:hypothetical protein